MRIRKTLLALVVAGLLVLQPWAAMPATNFPASLDTNTTLYNLSTGDVYIYPMHNNPKDAILALEAKVGVDGSAIVTSLDYLLKNTSSVDPGHTHTASGISFADGTVGAPGIAFNSDDTTGWWTAAAGQVAFSSSGVEIKRTTATGLGIFATNPHFPLDVLGTVRLRSASKLCFGGTGAADNDTCILRQAAHVAEVEGSLMLTDQAVGDNTLVLRGIAAKTGEFFRVFLNTTDANPIFEIIQNGVMNWGAGGGSAVDTNLYRSGAGTLTSDGNLILGGTLNVSGATVTLASGTNIVLNTVTGTKIGTATTQRLGFWNATPTTQQANTVDIKDLQSTLGFRATGASASPLDLDGGTLTAGDALLEEQLQYVTAGSLVLAGGANNNVALGTTAIYYRITGPGAPFNITGLSGGVAGRVIVLYSTVSQTLVLNNENAGSTTSNRITTLTGADISCTAAEPASATLVYDGTTSRWIVTAVNNCPTV